MGFNYEEIKPIYGYGSFLMLSSGMVIEEVKFYYEDPNYYYINLDEIKLKKEYNLLKKNMQNFLDEEIILINSKKTRAKVIDVDIGIVKPNIPFIRFLIIFKGKLKKGINTYENIYDEEVTEYPYNVAWILPGKVIRVNISGIVKVEGNKVKVRVMKGVKVGGRESIVFSI
jgi:hypothetical protein